MAMSRPHTCSLATVTTVALADVYLSGFGIAQLNHDTPTPSADISAFGRLLLETVTGSAPDQREIEECARST